MTQQDDIVIYMVNGLPVYQHAKDDVNTFRFAIAGFIARGLCKNAKVMRTFYVSESFVQRALNKLSKEGEAGFFSKDGGKGNNHVITSQGYFERSGPSKSTKNGLMLIWLDPEHARKKLERRRNLMNQSAGERLVTGYDSLIDGLSLPDPDDRHVLAAAIASSSQVIVTFNTKDFPKKSLEPFHIHIQHPDTFVESLIDLNLYKVLEAAAVHRASLKAPRLTPTRYLASLEKCGLKTSATLFTKHSTAFKFNRCLREILVVNCA